MNCVDCKQPMPTPKRPEDPFRCATCREAARNGATYVLVEKPIGEATFPRCTADMFDRGVLTVTSLDDDAIIEGLPAGSWLRARVVNADSGWTAFEIENPLGKPRAAFVAQREVA